MWAIIVNIGVWVYRAFKVAAEVSMAWIRWAVVFLYNWSIQIGRAFMWLGRRTWTVLRATWDHVLKPGWKKFDKFVTDVHGWLEKHFAPLLKRVNEWRKKINGFWDKYIRPFVLILDVARATTRVLSVLGVEWARKLDAKLAALQSWIERWREEFNRRLNEAADWINWVVDEGGLFQRLVLLKSVARDAHDAWNVLVGAKSKPVTADQKAALKLSAKGKKTAEVRQDYRDMLTSGSGDMAATVAEVLPLWRTYLAPDSTRF